MIYYKEKAGKRWRVFKKPTTQDEPEEMILTAVSEAYANELVDELNRAYEIGAISYSRWLINRGSLSDVPLFETFKRSMK